MWPTLVEISLRTCESLHIIDVLWMKFLPEIEIRKLWSQAQIGAVDFVEMKLWFARQLQIR